MANPTPPPGLNVRQRTPVSARARQSELPPQLQKYLETGEALVRHPDVNVVLFTGSYEVGRRIQQLSAEHHDRIVAAEMGSKSAVIVCEDANFDLAVNAGIISAFKTSGQRCVSAGRVIVHESLIDKYAKAFTETAKRLKFGDPLDPANFAGPVIHEAAVGKVLNYNALAKKEGANILLDGGEIQPIAGSKGCFLSPFVYKQEAKPGVRTVREEVFDAFARPETKPKYGSGAPGLWWWDAEKAKKSGTQG